MLTESPKNDERESVTHYPLANGSENHQDAAEEEIRSWTGDKVSNASGSGSARVLRR